MGQMTEGTGLSKGFISKIENNITSPSLNTLQTVAHFLKIPLPYLLLEKGQRMRILRKHKRQYTDQENLRVEHLTSKGRLMMKRVKIPPEASIGDELHAGEECYLIEQGKILAEQGEDSVILIEGDSFSWNACVPHFMKNIGDKQAVILVAIYTDNELEDTL
jgi:quercetin dioxygenase-like cupin family protein